MQEQNTFGAFSWNEDQTTIKIFNLQRNVVTWKQWWYHNYTTEFYSLLDTAPQQYNQRGIYKNTLYKLYVGSQSKWLLHKRDSVMYPLQSYYVLDIISAVGGTLEMTIYIIGIFFLPLAQFSFQIKAIEKLYLSKTDDKQFFNSFCGLFKS